MAEVKYTQKQFFEEVLVAMADNPNAVAMAHKKLEQLANKSANGSSKKSEEHEAFFEVLRDILSEKSSEHGMRCNAILADERAQSFAWKDNAPTSSQRVSSMLRKMIANGDVVKTIVKGDSYFRLV